MKQFAGIQAIMDPGQVQIQLNIFSIHILFLQLLRKRHIGNDIVTIIFQEPDALPFTPQTVRSQFQHVFIIVRVSNANSDNTRYRLVLHTRHHCCHFILHHQYHCYHHRCQLVVQVCLLFFPGMELFLNYLVIWVKRFV